MRQLFPADLPPGAAAMIRLADRVQVESSMVDVASAVGETDKHETVLILGKKYLEASDEGKRFMLEHEAGHLVGGVFKRGRVLYGDPPKKGATLQEAVEYRQNAELFNIAHDCAIHHMPYFRNWLEQNEAVHSPYPVATFERNQLPPMPAESAYEELKKRGGAGGGCGRLLLDLSGLGLGQPGPASRALGAVVAGECGRLAGNTAGGGRALEGEAETPVWAKPLARELRHASGDDWRTKRTYRKPHRRLEGYPARTRVRSGHGLLLVDVSASMSDDTLRLIRQACDRVLRGCSLVLWDTRATPRMSARRFDRGLADVGGGGTSPQCAAHHRRPDEVSVWVTDGYVDNWPKMTGRDIVVLVAEGGLRVPTGARVVRAF